MLETILCIDDDPITLMLSKMVISKAFFSNEIATAKNGEEALQYFDTIKKTNSINKIQLVFLDLNMPLMDGWEFLNSFNTSEYAEFHNIKIIILSSTIDPEDLAKSKKYPMVIDFLPKPISKEMLEFLKPKI
jgi:CheY-like chemotaxis protein